MDIRITRIKPFGIMLEPYKKDISLKSLSIDYLRKQFNQEHLIVLRGFKTFQSSEDFSDYCELWGEISLWPFGKVLDLIEQDNPKDHIFDHSYVPFHWDGMYRPQVPEYQIFHCVTPPLAKEGGRTVFSNTVQALKAISSEKKDIWRKVTGIYQRSMEFYSSKTVSTIITKHPQKDFEVIRYNEPHSSQNGHFINPPDIEFTGVKQEELENFHTDLKNTLYAPKNLYAHEWEAGDIVIADNFSLLHGREAFTSKSPRHIRRVQVLSNPPVDNPGLETYQ